MRKNEMKLSTYVLSVITLLFIYVVGMLITLQIIHIWPQPRSLHTLQDFVFIWFLGDEKIGEISWWPGIMTLGQRNSIVVGTWTSSVSIIHCHGPRWQEHLPVRFSQEEALAENSVFKSWLDVGVDDSIDFCVSAAFIHRGFSPNLGAKGYCKNGKWHANK